MRNGFLWKFCLIMLENMFIWFYFSFFSFIDYSALYQHLLEKHYKIRRLLRLNIILCFALEWLFHRCLFRFSFESLINLNWKYFHNCKNRIENCLDSFYFLFIRWSFRFSDNFQSSKILNNQRILSDFFWCLKVYVRESI